MNFFKLVFRQSMVLSFNEFFILATSVALSVAQKVKLVVCALGWVAQCYFFTTFFEIGKTIVLFNTLVKLATNRY